MSSWRFLLIIPASCFLSALGWLFWPEISSLAQAATAPPVSDTAPTRTAGTGAGLAEAEDLIHSALDRLQSPQARCLQTTIWQRASLGETTFEAEGSYQSAPRGRIRIDLETRAGDASGKVRIISDGTRIVHAVNRSVSQVDTWTEANFVDAWAIVDRSHGKVSLDDVRRNFLQGRSGRGPAELLESLSAQFVWTQKEKVKRSGQISFKLTGTSKASAPDADSNVTISQCKLYLDVETLWPNRIEWWGTSSAGTVSAPLVQIEFREPVLAEALAPARLAEQFTIVPSEYPMQDQTERLAAALVH